VLYGTTNSGAAWNLGTVFRLKPHEVPIWAGKAKSKTFFFEKKKQKTLLS